MSKIVSIGNIKIGGGNPIAVQSMSTLRPSDTERVVKEAIELENVGCDILRYSVLDEKDALSFKEIKKHVKMPLVADIHFDYRLALKAIEGGADKVRINPGNIGSDQNVEKVARAIKESGIPVRVGANSGSVEKELLGKYGVNEISLGESALKNVAILEKFGVENIVISVKASSVKLMNKAYRYVASKTDYPLHLGVTEAGTEYMGTVKNSIGIGSLLTDGIGDTIRVSLSASPLREVKAGRAILSALDLTDGVKIIACPTCGRCEWNCMDFARKTEEFTQNINKPLKVAVMGCAVNGIGESKGADLGVAGAGNGECVIFVKGEIVKKVKETELEKEFFGEIEKCLR